MESSSQATASFSQPNRTLVIMAKAPKPGMVKTRLIESLPSSAVTALYRCLLEDTLALATSLTSVEVAVMCPESDQDELVQLLDNKVQVVAQKGEGLAAGLTSVFDISLPPTGSTSSHSIATVHISRRRFWTARSKYSPRMTWLSDQPTMGATIWWAPRPFTRRSSKATLWEQGVRSTDC